MVLAVPASLMVYAVGAPAATCVENAPMKSQTDQKEAVFCTKYLTSNMLLLVLLPLRAIPS